MNVQDDISKKTLLPPDPLYVDCVSTRYHLTRDMRGLHVLRGESNSVPRVVEGIHVI